MRTDYQLRHQLFGQQGSLWERQVDDTTRRRIRRIVKEAGNASVLTHVDLTATSAVNGGAVLVEDAFFRFAPGNYAVVGQAQREYSFHLGELADGTRLHVAYRGGYAPIEADAVPTQLARVSRDFLRDIGSAALPADRDWYLVPVPRDLTPLVIDGREDGTYLVNGIDFLAREGYIAMPDPPEAVIPIGAVRLSSARRKVRSASVFVRSTGRSATGRYLSEYQKKTQSLTAFRRAAAEYAGLFVTQAADVVLDAREVAAGRWVYNLAGAGPVEIRYPHTPLLKHQHLPPGFVVSGRFDVVASRYGGPDDAMRRASATWGRAIMLDGILPVNGLTWDGHSRVPIDYVSTGEGGKPHLRLHFGGPPSRLERLWDAQRLHEARTGVYLFDALGEPSTPSTVDFWELLENFYGSQLILVLLDAHTPRINTRIWRFVVAQRPQSCNALLGVDLATNAPRLAVDAQGIPLLDEFEETYVFEEGPSGVYYRPDGVSRYLRPGGAGYYLKP